MTTETRNKNKLWGATLVLISGLLYGMIGYFGIKIYEQGFSVPALLFWRFLVAAGWMLLVCLVLQRPRKRIQRQQLGWLVMLPLAVIGAISYSGGSVFFYYSSLYIGTGPAMVIFFCYPVFVLAFSLYFKKSTFNRYILLSLLMVMAGMLMLNGSGQHNLNNNGILLGMIAAFSYGVYVYYSEHYSSKADTLPLTLYICLGCALIFLVFSLMTHSFRLPDNAVVWRDILILGVVATALPIQLLLNGLKYVSSVKASIISVAEPVTTVIVGVLFMNEQLSGMQIMGVIVILVGAIVIQFDNQADVEIEAPLK